MRILLYFPHITYALNNFMLYNYILRDKEVDERKFRTIFYSKEVVQDSVKKRKKG